MLKILWVLGKKDALARWNLNQQQKKKKEMFPLGFHKNVSILLKLVSFLFVSFLGWCDLSRACLDPEVPTGTFLLFPSLDCPAFHLVFKFRHAVCSLSHSVTEISAELFTWPPCRHFQHFRLGFSSVVPAHSRTLYHHFYFFQLLLFSVRSLSSCCVA